MNICFISNFSKTYLQAAIGKELKNHGIGVYWIATNQKLTDYLIDEFGARKVLLISRENIDQHTPAIGEFKINELIYGDRILRHDPQGGFDFLKNIQLPIYNFLRTNNIRKVFGEITWAHELLIHRICKIHKELNCQFLNPHVVRIPNERFAFFTDEHQSNMLEMEDTIENSWKVIEAKPPNYLAINKKIKSKESSLLGKLDRVKRFVANKDVDKNDPTLLVNNKLRLQNSAQEEFNKLEYKKIKKTLFKPESERPFVFVGLHKQPEASVDVLGRYYEDQFQNINNLWRALPSGWDLIIKEHAVAIGDRSSSFYKKLQALPNVYLVDENVPSYEIIKKASLVATVSGSIAYEAALMDVPSVTFAPCFFNGLNACTQIKLEHLSRFDLGQISNMLSQKTSNINYFSKRLYKNTFEGNVLDPVTDPSVLDKENIEKLLDAYLGAISLINTNNRSSNLWAS